MSEIIKKFVDKLIQQGRVEQSELKGCSEEEIKKLEDYYNIKLPELYRQFLLVMGHGPIKIFDPDTLWTYKYLFENKDCFIEGLYEHDIKYRLSENAFVFQDSAEAAFLLFYINPGENDPPIYNYFESESKPSKIYESFSDYLEYILNCRT